LGFGSYSGTSLGFTQVEEVVICWFHIWFCQFHLKSGFFLAQFCDRKHLAKFLKKIAKLVEFTLPKKIPMVLLKKRQKLLKKYH
jgi:hypothetical protein